MTPFRPFLSPRSSKGEYCLVLTSMEQETAINPLLNTKVFSLEVRDAKKE